MRIEPPKLPQPETHWDKRVTFDEEVRKNLPKRPNRKSAVEEVQYMEWLVVIVWMMMATMMVIVNVGMAVVTLCFGERFGMVETVLMVHD
jgi:hypothetical protein